LAQNLISLVTEDPLRPLIEQDNALIAVDGNDGVFGEIQNPGKKGIG
jgi:hypothetical protein